eukprot:698617-Hanusia_phi.AAC.5
MIRFQTHCNHVRTDRRRSRRRRSYCPACRTVGPRCVYGAAACFRTPESPGARTVRWGPVGPDGPGHRRSGRRGGPAVRVPGARP